MSDLGQMAFAASSIESACYSPKNLYLRARFYAQAVKFLPCHPQYRDIVCLTVYTEAPIFLESFSDFERSIEGQ